jgi:RNA polymerase sigma-70 factor (ECF subfamily)
VLKTTEETARWRVFKARQKLMKVVAPELLPSAVQPHESP